MVAVYGNGLFGRVDKVPGLFCVATRFFHINYVPLFPLGSLLVTREQGKRYAGVPLPLNTKSLLIAYGTGLSIATAIIAGICTLVVHYADRPDANAYIPGTIAGAAVVIWIFFLVLASINRASFTRACELGKIAGLSEEGWAQLKAHYSEDVFEE